MSNSSSNQCYEGRGGVSGKRCNFYPKCVCGDRDALRPPSNALCDEIRNIARDAPMSAGTRTRLHAIAHDIEKALSPKQTPVETTSLTEAEELLKAWADPLPPNGKLYWAHVEKAREYFKKRTAVEPTELPEALRDPVKNLERGRELLKAWGRTPVTDAALAESKESPLARAVRIARGDTGPPTELVRFAEKASGHPVGIDTSSVSEVCKHE